MGKGSGEKGDGVEGEGCEMNHGEGRSGRFLGIGEQRACLFDRDWEKREWVKASTSVQTEHQTMEEGSIAFKVEHKEGRSCKISKS